MAGEQPSAPVKFEQPGLSGPQLGAPSLGRAPGALTPRCRCYIKTAEGVEGARKHMLFPLSCASELSCASRRSETSPPSPCEACPLVPTTATPPVPRQDNDRAGDLRRELCCAVAPSHPRHRSSQLSAASDPNADADSQTPAARPPRPRTFGRANTLRCLPNPGTLCPSPAPSPPRVERSLPRAVSNRW